MFKNCIICNKSFKTHAHDFHRRKCCSIQCLGKLRSTRMKGIPKTRQHKRKIALAHKGKKRPPFSKQWRENLSKARKGKKFSIKHRENISKSQRMEKGNNWKGGKHTHEKYILVKNWNHPFSDSKGNVPEHRLIMEKSLERYLTKKEVIHHINSIKHDNRLENLKLFPNQSEHIKFHNQK